MRSRCARVVAAALLLAALACSRPPVYGRYYQGLTWIEFKGSDIVLHGGLGDSARFEIDTQDKTKLAIFYARGQTVGRIVSPAILEFPSGDSAVAQAFQGRWAKEEAPATAATAEDKARDAAVIAGGWRIPGETHVLDFRAGGAYQWGPNITGTYTMLGGQRIRMTFVYNGQPSGHLEQRFAVSGDELQLTAPDGVVTKYERVK